MRPDHQRQQHALHDQSGAELEAEHHLGEARAERRGGEAVEEQERRQGADHAADRREHERFDQRADKGRRSRRSRWRATSRSPCARAATELYMVLRAPASAPNAMAIASGQPSFWIRSRGARRLVGEVRGLRFDVELEPRIVLDVGSSAPRAPPGSPGAARIVWNELTRLNRLCTTGEIGPDFRIEHAAAGIEHADHRPARRAERHRLAELEALEFAAISLCRRRSRWLPGLNIRPSITHDILARSAAPSGPMPRSGRLALVPLERLMPLTVR